MDGWKPLLISKAVMKMFLIYTRDTSLIWLPKQDLEIHANVERGKPHETLPLDKELMAANPCLKSENSFFIGVCPLIGIYY